MLVVVLGGLNTLGAYAERQAGTPADDACKAMLDYFRSSPGGEDYSDAGDRLRYLKGRLDKATANEAVVISEYLAVFDLLNKAGTGPTELVFDEPEVELVGGVGPRLMRVAQACTDLGHPELREYLNDIRDVDNVPL
jgi:hypothetical protein